MDEGLARGFSDSDRTVPRIIIRPLARFMQTEVAAGAVLVVAAAVALVWANSPWHESYTALWETELAFELGGWSLSHDLHHWVNDGLMTLFFAVVGLEIKREIVHGQLRELRAALMPIVAAFGGMVVPALVYTLFNAGERGSGGWGIPMATDIAFAVGVLALVGRRVPMQLKIFLLSIAVADDIGAIVVIALFYSTGIEFSWLFAAVAALALVAFANRLHVRHLGVYLLLAVAAWFALLESGVHATLAGVAVGLLTPARPLHPAGAAASAIRSRLSLIHGERGTETSDDEEHDEATLWEVTRIAREAVSPLHRVEHSLQLWSAFVVLPIFAVANAGVRISGDALDGPGTTAVAVGVGLGLVLGKPLGIVAASLLAARLGVGRLPTGATTRQIVGVGLLGGVGFTVALFVTGLAFDDVALTEAAKVGILAGSSVAAVAGYALLRTSPPTAPPTRVAPEPVSATV